MNITTSQIKIIQTIIAANKLAAYKDAIIASASNDRTTSTKELTKAEAAAIIKSLQDKYPYQPPPDPCHKMRGAILSKCHTLGWYAKDAAGKVILKNGKKVLDYDRINNFCIAKGGKRLDKFTFEELRDKMVYIFEKVEKSFLNKI
jgi:hypothetical protein